MTESGSNAPKPAGPKPPKKRIRLLQTSSDLSANLAPQNVTVHEPQSDGDAMDTQLVEPSDSSSESAFLPVATPGSPPRRLLKMPSSAISSSPSRVHGTELKIGVSDWLDLSSDHAILVGKSLAIMRIMDNGADVMAAIAPRRSGKTKFLTMMAEFLSAHSTWSADDREKLFSEYNLCTQHPKFFKDHFAKYSVIHLDLSSHMPSTDVDAIQRLCRSVYASSLLCVEYLRSILDKHPVTGNTGRYITFKAMKLAIECIEVRHGKLSSSTTVTIAEISSFLPDLINAMFMCPDGQKTVVIIDEYDKPLVHVLGDPTANPKARSEIVGVYTSFYSQLLKNSKHIKLGLMVGVFDVALQAMGSGLNNVSLYQAHTGAWNPNMDDNPFDTAFNLTAADVKGLVDQHVDFYASNESEDVRKSCKTEIMLHCFENFDGYCYGGKSFIFNTICVVKFLNSIKRRTSVSQLPHECMHYWASTGNMAMINYLRTDDAARFIEYSGTLVREYVTRHSYRYGDQSLTGVLLAKLKLVDLDTGLNELENLQGADLPFDLDAAKVANVARMCTHESLIEDIFTWSSGGYSVESVFRLLYQAGYLTPLTPNRVGIPNHDVFEAFVELSEKIYNKSGLPGKFSDHTLERLGLGQGNLIAFAHYLDEIVLQQPPVSSTDMKEKVYHLYMHALLAPLIGVGGFEIDHESQAEGGRMDIRIKPSCSNTSEVRPYIILELKHLGDVRKTRLEEAMADENLSLVADSALAKCQEAMLQIRQRYQPASIHRAKGSTMFLLIGVTFWRYRFSLIAHQLFSTKTHASRVTWARKPFTEEDISGQVANGVEFSIDDGNLVASNISK